MFDNDVVHKMLNRIEQDSHVLSLDDQQRALAYKINLETGFGLDQRSIVDIQRMYKLVVSERSPVTDAALSSVLSIRKVLKDLSTADKMLLTQERQFYNAIASKVNAGKALTQPEIEELLRLYARKGF